MKKRKLYYSDINFYYSVDVWKDEYIEYLWGKHFNKKYNSLTYLVDDVNGKVYNQIEDDWIHNRIDERSIDEDIEFNYFLLDRFKSKAYEEYYIMVEEKEKKEKNQFNEIFDYTTYMSMKEGYEPLSEEELEEIFLENFGGEI